MSFEPTRAHAFLVPLDSIIEVRRSVTNTQLTVVRVGDCHRVFAPM